MCIFQIYVKVKKIFILEVNKRHFLLLIRNAIKKICIIKQTLNFLFTMNLINIFIQLNNKLSKLIKSTNKGVL